MSDQCTSAMRHNTVQKGQIRDIEQNTETELGYTAPPCVHWRAYCMDVYYVYVYISNLCNTGNRQQCQKGGSDRPARCHSSGLLRLSLTLKRLFEIISHSHKITWFVTLENERNICSICQVLFFQWLLVDVSKRWHQTHRVQCCCGAH